MVAEWCFYNRHNPLRPWTLTGQRDGSCLGKRRSAEIAGIAVRLFHERRRLENTFPSWILFVHTSLKNDDNNVCFRQIKKTHQKKSMRESVNPSKTLAKLPRIFRISMRFSGADNMNQRLSQWDISFTIGPYAIGERTCTYLWTEYDVRNSRPYLSLLQQRRYNGDIWRWVLKQQLLIEKNQLILSGHTRNLKHKRSPNRSLVEAERMSLGPKCCEQA